MLQISTDRVAYAKVLSRDRVRGGAKRVVGVRAEQSWAGLGTVGPRARI